MDTTTAHLDEGCSVGAAGHQHFLTSGVQSWHGPLGQRRRMVAGRQRGHKAEMGGSKRAAPGRSGSGRQGGGSWRCWPGGC